MKCKIFCRRHFEIFFPQKIGFDISCKLSPQKTVCVKCQNQFLGKSNKNVINLSTAEFVPKKW